MKKIHKSKKYALLLNYICCNPNCKDGTAVQGHHIIPTNRGGKDEYKNIIALCRKCHRGNRYHKDWEDHQVELFTWKFYKEIEMLGATSDCSDEQFLKKVRNNRYS